MTPPDSGARSKVARALGTVALAVVLVSLVATVAYAVGAIGQRPWDNVEGETLFEAARIRQGLALYVDPLRGAFDYGPVPSRYYVLYPPVWSWLLSHVPDAAASAVARGFNVVAWFGLLGWIAWTAEPSCRRATLVGAAFAGGVYTLTLFAVAGRPDCLAVLLAGVALARSARLGRVDALSAILFALAPWVKPNVFGMALGAIVVDVAVRRYRALGPLAAAAMTTFVVGAILHVASGGAWITHLLRSTAQPLDLRLWGEQVASRLEFLGLPIAFAAYCGIRARTAPGVRLALGALAASGVWMLVSLGKIGSASNYCIEPALASLVLLAHAPIPKLPGRVWVTLAALALVQSLWDGVASVRSSYGELFQAFPAEQRALAHARSACNAGPNDVVLGDDSGIELALDGRVVATPFQMTHLARRGRYPLALWIADVQRPEVVGIVMENDLLERPLSQVSLEHDRFGPELRRELALRFKLVEQNGDWHTYARRDPG